MNTNTKFDSDSKLKRIKILIRITSIVIPSLIALLFKVKLKGYDFSFLPPIYAFINGITAILLVLALYFIKKGNRKLHQLMINYSMILSLLFLIGYVAYHMTSESTSFGGTGIIKYIYFVILISHIFLSIIIVPLVLNSYLFAWQGNYEKHKKWTKFTWPIWFFVAVSGVIVYFMISPYYK